MDELGYVQFSRKAAELSAPGGSGCDPPNAAPGVVAVRATVGDAEARSLFAEWDDDGPRLERVAAGFVFTEGPVWVPHLAGGPGLLFSDIPADTIYRWRPGDGHADVWRRPSAQSNGLTLDREGRLVTCEHERRRVTRTDLGGPGLYGAEPVVLAARHGGRRFNSPNDVAVRGDGTIFFTDPTYGLRDAYGADAPAHEEQPRRRVYRIASADAASAPPDAARPATPPEPAVAAEGFTQPNGLALSPDERVLYVGDSEEGNIRSFAVAPDGSLTGGGIIQAFARASDEGAVDGMRVDQAGRIWTTTPGGLSVLAPDGGVLVHLRFPEVTANVAFGDEDGRTLYVTATSSVYRLRLTVAGAAGRA